MIMRNRIMIRRQHIDKGKLNKLVYNKYQCDYNILLETVNCWSQYCTEQSNMLDPLYFGYVSFFTFLLYITVLEINTTERGCQKLNLNFLIFHPISIQILSNDNLYGLLMNHKNILLFYIKIGWKINILFYCLNTTFNRMKLRDIPVWESSWLKWGYFVFIKSIKEGQRNICRIWNS
jgi:hypothetical protein